MGRSSGRANKAVDAEQPWVLAKAAKAGDDGGGRRGCADVLGDLVEACRLVGLAAAPFLPGDRAAACSPSSGTPTRTAPDGNGGPPILDELALGRPRRPRPAGSRRRSRSSRASTSRPRLLIAVDG